MREFKAAEVVTSDGYVLKLQPEPLAASPVALDMSAPPAGKSSATDDDDEDLEDDERKEKRLRTQWDEHWTRLTLSSGARIPAYPGPDRAMRILGGS